MKGPVPAPSVFVSAAVALALTAPTTRAAEEAILEEVIVTAERREQNLQDVPISATVLSGDELDNRGVTDLNDIQTVAPSVAINTVNRSTFINIRGVGIAQSAPTSNPGVAFYIDGQLIPHEQFIGQAFYDIEAIEVLRGPQGTLTGQNSTGGAVYVRTPEPEYDRHSASAEQTFGNYDWVRSIAAANIGLSDNFALRVAGVYDKRDSFTDNIGPSPSEPGDIGLAAGRANLGFRFADGRISGNFRLEYFDWETDNNAIKNRNDVVSSDPFVIEEDARSFMNQQGHRKSLELRFNLTEGLDLRLLSSRQRGKTEDQTDGDRTATAPPQPPNSNVGRVAYARTGFKTWLHEANLLSTGEGPVQWVLGGFYMHEGIPVSLLRDSRNTTDFRQSNSTIITHAENETRSGFGQVNAFVTERVELIGGARYSKDTQRYNRIALPGPPLPPGTDRIGSPASSTEWTGKLGANLHASDAVMYYGTVSRGYKAGGVNLTLNTPDFLPEKNLVYEVGAKTTLLERRLRFNASAFYSDYEDIQFSSLFNALPLTQNAASGQALGGELELTGRFGAWGFNAGVGLLDAEFAADATIVNTVTNTQQTVSKGSDLPFSPELTANVALSYDLHFGAATLTPRLQWAHTARQLATPFPSVASIVPSRNIVDARVTLDSGNAWLVEAFATNVFDKTYIASQIQNTTSATGGIVYGAPRQFGLRATVQFGK